MAVKQQEQLSPPRHFVPVQLNGRLLEPNRRIPLNLEWVEEVRVNTSAVERRAATIGTRRTVKLAKGFRVRRAASRATSAQRSFQSFSQFHISDVTFCGSGNPS